MTLPDTNISGFADSEHAYSTEAPGRLIPFTQVRLNVVFGLAECIGSTR